MNPRIFPIVVLGAATSSGCTLTSPSGTASKRNAYLLKRLFLSAAFIALLFPQVVFAQKAGAPSTPPPAKEAPAPKKPIYELPKTGVNQPRPNGGWINV